MRKALVVLLIWIAFFSPLPQSLVAAIGAGTTWETRPTVGASGNGAGFTIGVGTIQATLTDISTDVSNPAIIYSSTHGSWAGDLNPTGAGGKYIKITTTGTAAMPGYYQLIGTAAGNGGVLDRSVGAVSLTGLTGALYPGIDRTQQTAAAVVINNGTVTATTTAASSNIITFTAGYTPTSADLGNVYYAAGGTNINSCAVVTSCRYEITAETSTTWTVTGPQTLTTAAGAGASLSGSMGGAADIPDTVIANAVNSNRIFVKNTGTWMTGGLTPTQGFYVENVDPYTSLIGYNSVRSDGGQVTVQPTAVSLTAVSLGTSIRGWAIENFIFDGSGTYTFGSCVNVYSMSILHNLKCNNFTATGISATSVFNTIDKVEVTAGQGGCTAGINISTYGNSVFNSYVHGNLCPGATNAGGGLGDVFYNNIFANNSTYGLSSGNAFVIGNTFDNNPVGLYTGSSNSSAGALLVKNNLFSNQTTAAMELYTSAGLAQTKTTGGNCYFNNAQNWLNSADEGITNPINGAAPSRSAADKFLSSSPYISGTYTLNPASPAAQGGVPTSLPGLSVTSYPSCGAVQPQATSGGSVYVQ